MEDGTESASSSALAWSWTIEALASFKEVKPSLLHDVIDNASKLLDGTRNNAAEMVALKCLEGLFGPLNDIGENVPPAQVSKVVFDSSESCENVVKRIYKETPESAFGVAGPDMLKWDVKPFIDQKKASMRCTLLQLKDSILDGTHPYADFLMQKSGLPIDKRDSVFPNNEDNGLDNSSCSPHGRKEGKGNPLLENERRMSAVNPSSSNLLPSKRSGVDFTSEDEARQLPGCDDGFINVKKPKHHSAHTLYSGQEVASSHGTELVEDSSERSGPQIERDDTDHLDKHHINLVEDELVVEHFRSKNSGQYTATEVNISPNNENLELDRSSSPHRKKEGKGSPLLEDERRISVVNPSNSSLLPSKRSSVDVTSEDEPRQLPGCDDGFINFKKPKHHSSHTLYSGQEVASSHETEVSEDSSERNGLQIERDDTDHLDRPQINLVEDDLVEEHFRSKNSGQCTATDELHQGESEIPCYTVLDSTQDGEMLEVGDTEKVGDGIELPSEPNASNHSPAEGNLPNTSPNNSKCDSGHDYHINEMITVSHSGFLSTTVATNVDVGMNPDKEEKDVLSDSDGYHETLDIVMRKKEFLSSQCMVNHDSVLSADMRELTVCVKCNEDGQLLSCNISDCPLVVHAKCLGSSARMSNESNFCCPFCLYSLAISEYLEAKKHAALAKKNVASFCCTALEHQSKVITEVLQQKDLDPSRRPGPGPEDLARICEELYMENKDNQVTLDGENVNEVVDHQSTSVTDTEQLIEFSKPMHIANSSHREHKSNLSRVVPDVLSGEKEHNKEHNGDLDMEKKDNQATLDGEHVNEVVDHQSTFVTDTEQIIELSKPMHIANSNHREHESNLSRVVHDVLSGEKDNELVDQECTGNEAAELVDHECHGNTVVEMVDQESRGNDAELEDGQKATETHDIYETDDNEHKAMEEDLQYQTDENEHEAAFAIITEGEKSSDDGNDESIISRYSIRFRQKCHHTRSESHQLGWKKLPWTAEEEETLLEGVRKFSCSVDRSPTIPWKNILEFGSNVFLKDRTSIDLQNKWRNLSRRPKFK